MRTPAVVLCAPFDLVGRTIDRVTGRTGWSHVCLDPGLPDVDGDPLLVDIDRVEGVRLARQSVVIGGRAALVLELPPLCHEYTRRRCMARVGESYSLLAMAVQPLQLEIPGAYCSRVVAECLPSVLRELLPACPSPADFLRLRRHTGAREILATR